MAKVTVASRKIATAIVNIGGVEHVIEFQNGIAHVEKEVRDYLTKRFPENYYDPNVKSSEVKFDNDYDAIRFYINKLKTVECAPRLCSLLKSEYENLNGDLLSGKYTVRTVEPALVGNAAKTPVEDDSDDDELISGGDSIKASPDDDEDLSSKEIKKKKKKKKHHREEEVEAEVEEDS
jgi:hypothetical protein